MNASEMIRRITFSKAYEFLDRDPEQNFSKLIDWLEKLDKKGYVARLLPMIRKYADDPNSNWYKLAHSVWEDVDGEVRKTLFTDFLINGNALENERLMENRKKYQCNIPWVIMMDPASTCSPGRGGDPAARQLNLSFDEMDSIVEQGKMLGTCFYVFSGGEPLERREELIALCNKNSDCVFMERGPFRFQAENFYDAAGGTVEIPLDPLLTPQQNAAKYYKRYTKAKTAERYLREQMELARSESAYLESVLEEIREAETEQDFLDIRGELREAGYLRGRGREKKEMKRAAKPREFRTSGGFRVLVGRNNHQNDRLTLKDADRRDLWFHTRQIHGSHAVLCTQGREPGEDDLLEAARLAAYYSQARESRSVPVDYTPVKNVRKPSGGRPGMVIYSNSRTLSVTPDAELVKRLQVK